jgi:hypothetical protein
MFIFTIGDNHKSTAADLHCIFPYTAFKPFIPIYPPTNRSYPDHKNALTPNVSKSRAIGPKVSRCTHSAPVILVHQRTYFEVSCRANSTTAKVKSNSNRMTFLSFPGVLVSTQLENPRNFKSYRRIPLPCRTS